MNFTVKTSRLADPTSIDHGQLGLHSAEILARSCSYSTRAGRNLPPGLLWQQGLRHENILGIKVPQELTRSSPGLCVALDKVLVSDWCRIRTQDLFKI